MKRTFLAATGAVLAAPFLALGPVAHDVPCVYGDTKQARELCDSQDPGRYALCKDLGGMAFGKCLLTGDHPDCSSTTVLLRPEGCPTN
jgi:hypothetical protein